MGSRVLVLGAGPLRDTFFMTAARMDVETVLVDDGASPRYDRVCDEVHALRLTGGGGFGRDGGRLEELAGKADGIVALSDWGIPIAAALAHRLGAPGCGAAAARRGHDKAAVRAALASAGIDDVAYRRIRTADEAADFVRRLASGLAVVKPLDGTAGRGVRIVRGPEEAAAAALHGLHSGHGEVLIEEFLPGAEYSLEAVVRAGRVSRLVMTDKVTSGDPRFIELRHTVGGYRDPAACARARRFLERVVEALAVEDAIVHAEAKDGPAGWQLVEIGLRPAGGLIVDLVRQAVGVDLYEEQLRMALGLEPTQGPGGIAAGLSAAVQYVAGRGVVSEFPSMAPVFDGLDTVCGAERLLQPGTEVRALDSNRRRAGYVRACSADGDRLGTQLAEAAQRLTSLLGLEPI